MQITIWTVGHSNRSIDKFLKLLYENGIQIIVDVRCFPTSKIEHFKKENMEKWLPKYGIEYVWLGKELGGYRKGGYRQYMRTKFFKEGIAKLLDIAKAKKTCIMCMEANPRYCHRRFISKHLEKTNVNIVHIITEGQKTLG